MTGSYYFISKRVWKTGFRVNDDYWGPFF